ncbi:MAG TPA: carboxypeptidase-like regulatory domain-containing protein, partial [Pyrinomonadaceae bacterium]|nr:carboxypeptidase-like regulatory domain-containing protein [Pyrinomonadaceae bacterium]
MVRVAVAVCAAVLFCAGSVRAQQPGAATLRGVVRDPNGAVIPGVAVMATSVSTGAARETKT